MRHESLLMPPALDGFKRAVLLSIIGLGVVSTVIAWWVMGARGQVSPALHWVHVASTLVLSALFLASWRRWLPQHMVELCCLLFGVGVCAVCMALRMYSPAYGAGIDLQPLYLWIPIMYVFAFTVADSKTSLAISLGIMALFVGVSLPYLVRDINAPYANFTLQLHVVSAVLIAALYFFSSYQRRLQVAQLAVDQLAHLSSTDELTKLPNRRRMAAVIGAELAQSAHGGAGFAVVLFDIDHFKAINDRCGHGVGDEALRALATRAIQRVGDADVLGRWGGDEFVVLLRGIGAAQASRLADALCVHVAAEPLFASQRVAISCGMTVACDGDSIDSLLQRADAALYAAKRAGRNRAESVLEPVPASRQAVMRSYPRETS